jgi:hypothetical protein
MNIVDQEFTNVPIDRIQPHPRNPNRGDVGAIAESIEANGFYGIVGFQKSTGNILFGNHRYEAARLANATHIPAMEIDVDDVEALRILTVDNRAAEKSQRDLERLAAILDQLKDTEIGLSGTGYTTEDFDSITEELDRAMTTIGDEDAPSPDVSTQYILTVHCTTESDLERVFHEMTERGYECRMLT